jgi:hypothetical protein
VPFTGSHPAAVLPFLRWGLPPSALVAGSIAPDLPYYAPGIADADRTHALLGAVSVDVVLGLAVFVLWHGVWGPVLVASAPWALRRRLPAPAGLRGHLGQWYRAGLVLAALTIGAITHVVWDSFTHEQLVVPRHIGWLRVQYGPLPGYAWAQHLSGLVGAGLLVGWCVRWWRRQHPRAVDTDPPGDARHTLVVVVLVGVLAAASGAVEAATRTGRFADAAFLGITRAGTAVAIALTGLAIVRWLAGKA